MNELFLDLEKDSMHVLTAEAKFTGVAHIVRGALGSGYYDGDIVYFENGYIHKEDGPAIVSATSRKYDYYVLWDQVCTPTEYWETMYRKYKGTERAPWIMANILGAK